MINLDQLAIFGRPNPDADRRPISETELKTFTNKAFDFIRGAAYIVVC